ncbi:hypothetical protein OK016_27170 [Vibrio chagasii]|nr:hypothetical protein [Vibrio chagasii]
MGDAGLGTLPKRNPKCSRYALKSVQGRYLKPPLWSDLSVKPSINSAQAVELASKDSKPRA